MSEQAQRLESAIAGDAEALRALLAEHGPAVWSRIDGEIGKAYRSAIDADDVMQITYMEAFLQAARLEARSEGEFHAWLYRIAQNNLRDAIRALERKKRPSPTKRVGTLGGGDSYVGLVELLGETSETPSRAVAAGEAARAIDAALGELPPDYALVIRLYDLEGKPIGEVAERLKRSSGAVHMLRARAHERLREVLGSATDFFSRVG